ncbi:MAG: 50S ribosomal protein L35 [Deltaproteobacteria bacterium]|nr:50S ribosomal protein L35 [Deltaproteobacteria bacterium]
MPKMKTNHTAAKRFKATADGKIKHKKAYSRHMLTTKTTKFKRSLRSSAYVDGANLKSIKKLLPYLGL